MTDQPNASALDRAAGMSEAEQSEQASLKQWLAVSVMGLATFCAVTTELLPVGLLPEITATYAVSPGAGGMMITTPSIVAAVAAPLVMLGAGRIDRRVLSCWLMLLFAVAHAATALAPSCALRCGHMHRRHLSHCRKSPDGWRPPYISAASLRRHG